MPADDGVEKSAILLIALGEDYASEVLKHLGPKEVQKLGYAMAALKSVPREKIESVLAEFHQTAAEATAVVLAAITDHTAPDTAALARVGRLG